MVPKEPDAPLQHVYVATVRRDLRALAALLSGEAAARAAGQIAILLTARLLGPSDFGILAVALTVLGFATVLADLGLGETAASRLTHRRAGPAVFQRVIAPLRLRAAASLAGIMLIATLLFRDQPTVALSCLIRLAVPGSIALTARYFGYRIVGNFPAAARWSATNGLSLWLGSLVGAVLLRSAWGAIVGVIAATSVSALVLGAFNHAPAIRWRSSVSWARASAPLLGSAIAIAVYSRVDRIFVASAEGNAAAGAYAAAYSVVMLVAVAGSSIQAALLPRLIHEDRQPSHPVWRKRLIFLIVGAAPFAILLWIAAPLIIHVLYGPAFFASIEILRWLSPLVVLYVASPFVSAMLLARRQTDAIAATSAVNLCLALVLYPVTIAMVGVAGAAITSVFVETVGLGQQSAWLLASDRRQR